jgi:hypothetical protein
LNIRKPYRFKLGVVCKALQSNKSLHDFWSNYKMDDKIARVFVHVLKSHNNATLRSLSPAFLYDAYPRLQYYLHLNQCGRAQARDPETSIQDFIALLVSTAVPQNNGLETLSLQYGLLRESPGLWSVVKSGDSRTSSVTSGSLRKVRVVKSASGNKKRRL